MKTAIVRTWEMVLGSQVFDEVSRKFGPDAPTMAGILIASGETRAEARISKPVLPLGCFCCALQLAVSNKGKTSSRHHGPPGIQLKRKIFESRKDDSLKKVFQFSAICSIGTALAISACTLVSVPLFGQGVIQPVKVVNTPNVNVVNTPSVSVSNTPNVSVTNTPNVSIANTPSVNVANTPTVTLEAGASVNVTSPLDGEGNSTPLAVLDAVQPYEDTCTIFFSGSDGGNCSFQTIPSGKRLVIQEFDAAGTIETGLKPLFIGFSSPSTVTHYFPATFMGTATCCDNFATHQETRLYVPASAAPFCFVGVSSNSSGNYECDLSGFLVDVPLGSSSGVAPVQPHRVPALPNGRNPMLRRQQNNTGH